MSTSRVESNSIAESVSSSNDSTQSGGGEATTASQGSWLWRATFALAARIPTMLTMAALVALFLWGHQTGWTLPKLSLLTHGAQVETEPWCEEHNVAESICIECQADLLPKSKSLGWCKEHGVHQCLLEHPELAQTDSLPVATASDRDRIRSALGIVNRPQNESRSRLHERRIQFSSADAVEKAGITVEPVWTASIIESISAPGELLYEPTRVARLSSRLSGSVFRVEKNLGDRVSVGEVVALIDCPEVGKAKAEFLTALAQFRLRAKLLQNISSAGTGIVPGRSVTELEGQLGEAKIRLTSCEQYLANLGLPIRESDWKDVPDERLAEAVRLMGLPDPIRASLAAVPTTANLLCVVAPMSGVVVTRDVVAGETIDPTKVLAVIADPQLLALTLEVRLEDVRRIRVGQEVRFRADGDPNELQGTINWMSPEANHKTRTVQVRASIANSDNQLRANTFGIGRIVLRVEPKAVVVPSEAVHTTADGTFVFVRDRDFPSAKYKFFHTRSVRVGVRENGLTELLVGAVPGELVAVKGSGGLRSELLRGSMGEGCACGH